MNCRKNRQINNLAWLLNYKILIRLEKCYAVARRALRPTYHLGALAPRCTALPALGGAGLTIAFGEPARSDGPPP